MVIVGYPSLLALAGALGAVIGGGEIALDTMQQQCVNQNLERFFSYTVQGSAQRYEIYPAIAAAERILKDGANVPDRMFRQGVVIRTTDTGDWYYIGGISNYWSSSKLIVYQGGSKFTSYGKLSRDYLDKFISTTGGLGIVPVFKEKFEAPVWYNPPLFSDCNGMFGVFWNYLAEYQVGILSVPTYAPRLLEEISAKGNLNLLTYVGKDGSTYLSRASEDIMRFVSDSYPFIYLGIGTNPVVAKSYHLEIYPLFTFNGMSQELASSCKKVMPSALCALSSEFLEFNGIDIGAPVLAVLPCGTGCSSFGLAGFVLSYFPIKVGSFYAVYLRVVVSPSEFTSSAIAEYAETLNVADLLNGLLDARKKFKKAVSQLSISFPTFIAMASALIVEWTAVTLEEGISQAEQRAKELKEMYDRVVKELTGSPPPYTNRYAYDQWWVYKSDVERCAQQIILDNPEITYDELKRETEECAHTPT